MHPDWRNFLQQQGAIFSADGVGHYGDSDAELRSADRHAVLADLSHEGLIAVSGTGARTFLHGQLSTDVLALTPDLGQFSSWSNAKGRVVTLLRLFECADTLYMNLPHALMAPVLKKLSLYTLRAKVKLADTGDAWARFGLAGHAGPDLLASCGLSAPSETNHISVSDGVYIIRLHGKTPRFALHGEPEKLRPLWQALSEKDARPAGADVWALLRIRAGEPAVHPETLEHFVAQMLGLEELGAINFKKGCYLGQEVIARAHYRGGVKRHLRHAFCAASEPIRPGATIHVTGGDQAVAEVVDAARDAEGMWQMLIVLQDEFIDTPLRTHDAAVILIV
ncbi:MAG: folate-binding protein [Gammaproteobacteria bacterium]